MQAEDQCFLKACQKLAIVEFIRFQKFHVFKEMFLLSMFLLCFSIKLSTSGAEAPLSRQA